MCVNLVQKYSEQEIKMVQSRKKDVTTIHLGEDIFCLRVRKTSSKGWSKRNVFLLTIRLQDIFKTFSRRPQNVFKTSFRNVFKAPSINFKTFRRRPTYESSSQTILVNTSSKRGQDVFKTYSTSFWERLILATRLENLWLRCKFSISRLFGYMRWLLLKITIFLLKSNVRRDVTVSVNKESINESSSKNVFLRF